MNDVGVWSKGSSDEHVLIVDKVVECLLDIMCHLTE